MDKCPCSQKKNGDHYLCDSGICDNCGKLVDVKMLRNTLRRQHQNGLSWLSKERAAVLSILDNLIREEK